MNAQTLLEAPKAKPRIIARVSKVNNLVEVSTQARKTSTSLRKTFEKGVYQRKTQLSVLNRYKKRLDTINEEQDKKYEKKTKEKPKKIQIPKFKGSFFTKGSADDPLKAIGALAAFNSLEKLLEGDLLGALSPGMVAAGALLGPGLLGLVGGAAEGFFTRGPKPGRGFDATGRRTSTSSQQRYLSRYGDKAFKNRFGNDALKRTQQGMDAGTAMTKGARTSKAFAKFGSALIPGVGAVVGAADAAMRAQAGDQFGATIAGTGAALDAAAAATAATGIGLPIAGLLSLASFALDATNLIRDLTGQSAAEEEKNTKLKEQTKKEKQLSKAKGDLTFSKTLVSYETALVKFEEFSKGFTGFKTSEEQINFEKRQAANIENLGGGSSPISDPGYEFTQNISQYLTGDPNSPAYEYYHGTQSNYHDHLAFKDRPTAERAYNFLKRKGIKVTEFKGYDTVGRHASGSAHYSGLAFDVPGYQWGGSGAIGEKEYQGSAKVRAFMNDFFDIERRRSKDEGNNMGSVIQGPRTGYLALLHGTEAVIPVDNDHTKSGGDPLINISPEIINNITSRSKIYQTAVSDMPPEVITVPMPVMPPEIQYVSSSSAEYLNIQDGADKRILKMLYYSVLG
jgi:hypothetical protein